MPPYMSSNHTHSNEIRSSIRHFRRSTLSVEKAKELLMPGKIQDISEEFSSSELESSLDSDDQKDKSTKPA